MCWTRTKRRDDSINSRNVSEKKGGALPTYLMTAWEAHRPYIHSWYLIKKKRTTEKKQKETRGDLSE